MMLDCMILPSSTVLLGQILTSGLITDPSFNWQPSPIIAPSNTETLFAASTLLHKAAPRIAVFSPSTTWFHRILFLMLEPESMLQFEPTTVSVSYTHLRAHET